MTKTLKPNGENLKTLEVLHSLEVKVCQSNLQYNPSIALIGSQNMTLYGYVH